MTVTWQFWPPFLEQNYSSDNDVRPNMSKNLGFILPFKLKDEAPKGMEVFISHLTELTDGYADKAICRGRFAPNICITCVDSRILVKV